VCTALILTNVTDWETVACFAYLLGLKSGEGVVYVPAAIVWISLTMVDVVVFCANFVIRPK